MRNSIGAAVLRRAPLASLIAAVLAAPAAAHAEQTRLVFAGVEPALERAPGERRARAFDATAAKQPWTIAPSGGPPANILFSVNFDSDCSQDPPAPPPSPPAPYATPLGFTVTNVDARTPAAAVNYVTNAWIVREDFAFNVNDCAMFSTSWYSPAGAANDWAAFPAAASLTPTANTQLRWNAIAYDPDYPDGYEVRYSTAGTAPADFLANPVLLTIPAENSSWTARTLNLPAALAGTPLRLAFRNNSVDQFLLLIDDIVVENIVAFDPAINAVDDVSGTMQYARVPAFLQFPYELEATLANAGSQALTDVAASADVLVDAAPVDSFASTPIPLAAGASADVVLGAGVFDMPGVWTTEAEVTAAEGDEVTANSALAVPLLEVTADEITRAEGAATGSLGIGAGNGGELGVDFEIPISSRLTSIRIAYNNSDTLPDNPDPDPDGDGVGDMNGRQMEAVVRAWNEVDDEPGDIVFTATATVAADAVIGDLVLDFPVTGIVLAPGRYLFAAVEPNDLTLGVQQTDERFTAGTTWVNWPTSPFGGWANNEEFGVPSFEKPYVISAILQAAVPVPDAVDDAATLDEDGSTTGNVGTNDTPSDEGGSVWALDQGPANGDVQFAADGAYTYTPDANFNGTDSFTYTLCDVDNDCDTATVALTIDAVDDLPLAEDDAFTVGPEEAFAGSVAGNDTAGDGAGVFSVVAPPATGTFDFQPDGSFTYTPQAGVTGAVTFTYQLCDADSDCDQAQVTLDVLPVPIFGDGFED